MIKKIMNILFRRKKIGVYDWRENWREIYGIDTIDLDTLYIDVKYNTYDKGFWICKYFDAELKHVVFYIIKNSNDTYVIELWFWSDKNKLRLSMSYLFDDIKDCINFITEYRSSILHIENVVSSYKWK